MDKSLETFSNLLEALDTKSAIQDFVKAFEAVITVFEDMKKQNEQQATELQYAAQMMSSKMEAKLATLKDGLTGKDGTNGKDGRDGTNGKDGLTGPQGETGPAGSPDTSEDIRNKLELLLGEDRLDASAIKGLDEYWKRIGKLEGRPNVGGWSSAGGGKIVKLYDISSQLNGSLKTFALPAFWRVISVSTSSNFPLQPIVDWTTDGAAMTITFTSTVDATTVLSGGQIILVEYAEA